MVNPGIRPEAVLESWPVIGTLDRVWAFRPVARRVIVVFAGIAQEFGGAFLAQPPLIESFPPRDPCCFRGGYGHGGNLSLFTGFPALY